MIALGHFLFRYRNGIFPVIYALLLFQSHPILADYRLAALLGLPVAAAGQLLRAITVGLEYLIRGRRQRHGHAERFVQGGVFDHCRNPLHLGNFLIILGVSVVSNSLLFASIAIPFFALAYWAIITAEEKYLRDNFGPEFEVYCAEVNRIVPDFSGFKQTLVRMHFNWRRLITAEYGSAYIWMSAMILVVLRNASVSIHHHAGRQSIRALWSLFITVTLGYAISRLLKKSGHLRGPVNAGA